MFYSFSQGNGSSGQGGMNGTIGQGGMNGTAGQGGINGSAVGQGGINGVVGQGVMNGIAGQGYASLTQATAFPIAHPGNKLSDDQSEGWKEKNSSNSGPSNLPNGLVRKQSYADNEHYLRKSASVQIIAHEPSRCEGCFDGRLPLLMVVIFIASVIFLLCVGVVVDFQMLLVDNNDDSTTKEIASAL
ncbi:spidroin-1, partial [Eurytemora carolleeae]|uniref:spidroin-1 n=1 Tax=Eurytemora carolleeae TaxID=1294199 RepID=UPI000C7865F6